MGIDTRNMHNDTPITSIAVENVMTGNSITTDDDK